MRFYRAVLDDANELTGYEEVAEADWKPAPRRIPVHDRDLVPRRYYWTGETFLPIPLGGEDEIRKRPRLLKAIVLGLIDVDDNLPQGSKLKPQIRAVLDHARQKF